MSEISSEFAQGEPSKEILQKSPEKNVEIQNQLEIEKERLKELLNQVYKEYFDPREIHKNKYSFIITNTKLPGRVYLNNDIFEIGKNSLDYPDEVLKFIIWHLGTHIITIKDGLPSDHGYNMPNVYSYKNYGMVNNYLREKNITLSFRGDVKLTIPENVQEITYLTPKKEKLDWEILPLGFWKEKFGRGDAQKQEPKEELERIKYIDSLGPECWYEGKILNHRQYLIAFFKQTILAECSRWGNAIYVFDPKDNWEELCQLTKKQLLEGNYAKRIIHGKHWKERIQNALEELKNKDYLNKENESKQSPNPDSL